MLMPIKAWSEWSLLARHQRREPLAHRRVRRAGNEPAAYVISGVRLHYTAARGNVILQPCHPRNQLAARRMQPLLPRLGRCHLPLQLECRLLLLLLLRL